MYMVASLNGAHPNMDKELLFQRTGNDLLSKGSQTRKPHWSTQLPCSVAREPNSYRYTSNFDTHTYIPVVLQRVELTPDSSSHHLWTACGERQNHVLYYTSQYTLSNNQSQYSTQTCRHGCPPPPLYLHFTMCVLCVKVGYSSIQQFKTIHVNLFTDTLSLQRMPCAPTTLTNKQSPYFVKEI